MGELSIGLFSSLIGSMNTDFAIKLAESATNKGHKVNLWLSGNATTLSKKNQKSFKDYSYLIEKIEGLLKKGISIAVCEACAKARGIHKEDVIDGIDINSMGWYVAKAATSNRVLHIGRE